MGHWGNYFFLISLLLFSCLSPISVAALEVSVAVPVLVLVVDLVSSLEPSVPQLGIVAVVVVVLLGPPLFSK